MVCNIQYRRQLALLSLLSPLPIRHARHTSWYSAAIRCSLISANWAVCKASLRRFTHHIGRNVGAAPALNDLRGHSLLNLMIRQMQSNLALAAVSLGFQLWNCAHPSSQPPEENFFSVGLNFPLDSSFLLVTTKLDGDACRLSFKAREEDEEGNRKWLPA